MSGRVMFYGGMVSNGLNIYLDASKRDSFQNFQQPNVGGVWKDASGNGNDLTLSGPITYTQDNAINYFSLNGLNTYMYSANFFPIQGPATICILCRPTATGNRNFVTVSNTSGVVGPFSAFQIGYDATTGTALSTWKYGGTILTSGGVLNTSSWYYICVTYSAQEINTYIDGVLISTLASPSIQTGLGRFLIGTYRHLPSPLQVMQGDVATCLYYNRTLSSSEILQNYNATKKRYQL
jgi:hypothetical protein